MYLSKIRSRDPVDLEAGVQVVKESQADYKGRNVVLVSKDMHELLSSFLELKDQAFLSSVNKEMNGKFESLMSIYYKTLATYLLANRILEKTTKTLVDSTHGLIDPAKVVQIVSSSSPNLDGHNSSFEQEAKRIFNEKREELQNLVTSLDECVEPSASASASASEKSNRTYYRTSAGYDCPRPSLSKRLSILFRRAEDSSLAAGAEQEENSPEIDGCDSSFIRRFHKFAHILEDPELSKSEKVDAIFRHAELQLSTMLAGSLYPNIGVNRMEAFDAAERIYPHLKAKGDLHFANMFLNCSSEFNLLREEVEEYKRTSAFTALSVFEQAEKISDMILSYNEEHPGFASWFRIQLINKGLTTIPGWVKNLQLNALDVSRNLLTHIPEDFGGDITDLCLANNRIFCISANMLKGARLRDFDIRGNYIRKIPRGFSLSEAEGIRKILIGDNKLGPFPPDHPLLKTVIRLFKNKQRAGTIEGFNYDFDEEGSLSRSMRCRVAAIEACYIPCKDVTKIVSIVFIGLGAIYLSFSNSNDR